MAGRKEYEALFRLQAELGSSFNSSFARAKSPVAQLQSEINKLNRTQADISSYRKQQNAVEATRKKLGMLKQQYDNIQNEMKETGDSSASMQNRLLAKQNQIDRTTSSLAQQTDKLNSMDESLKKAGIDTKNLSNESKRLDTELEGLAESQTQAAQAAEEMSYSLDKSVISLNNMLTALGVTVLIKQLADVVSESAQAAITFESAMAGVDKTSDLTRSELQAMADEFQRMSTVIPVSANELAEIAEAAGQLGVAKENIASFTEVMAKLSTATTMTAEEGAMLLAQFANITQMDPSNYERLASATVDLGNNFATTEQKIIDMAQGMAASASLAGMSEADILGLSAAISSLGIEAQAGSSSASKLITELDKAVKTGNGIQEFGRIAGMAGSDFAKAWGEDAANALARFITGLNDIERHGKSATVILEEMGISEVRLQRMLLSLANSGDLMNRAIETSNQAWRDNTALQDEANKRYGTTESKVELAKNAFENLKVTLGEHLTPVIGDVAQKITDVVTGITNWMEANPELTQAILTMGGILVLGMGAILAYTGVVNLATIAMGAFKAAIPGIGWVLGGVAALAVVGGAFVLLKNHIDNNRISFEKLDEEYGGLMKTISEHNVSLDLIDEYRQLKAEIDGGKLSTEELAAKQERLAEVKSLLVQRSEGLITATDNETEAFDRQVAALETIIQMERDQARGKAYENLTKQSKAYTEAIKQEQRSSIELAAAQAKQEEVVAIIGGGYDEAINKANNLGKAMGSVWDDESLTYDEQVNKHKQLVKDASELMSVLHGTTIDYSGNPAIFFWDLENLDEGSTKFRESWNEANAGVAKYQGEVTEAQKVQEAFLQNLVDGVTVGGITLAEYETMLTETFSSYENGAQIVADIMEYVRQRTKEAAAAASDLGDKAEEVGKQALTIQDAVDQAKVKMDELAAAYDQAYDSAYASISGQLKLFSELQKPEKTLNTDQMLASLQAQAAYLDSYNANLQKAKEMGVAQELVSQLSDGSAESAQHLQSIVNSSSGKITEINEAFARVSEGKETFAATVAEMETDFTEKMANIQQELVTKVSQMNLYQDAYKSGKDTIQGLINGAEGMKGQVYEAYESVAQAAIDAINAKMKIQSPSKVMEEISDFNMQGLIIGAEKNQEQYANAMKEVAQAGVDAYQNADILSVLGPMAYECDGRIFLHTEQPTGVITSDNSVNNSKGVEIKVSPVYNITGSVNTDAVRDTLEKQNDGLRELILNVVEEADIDRRRRSYNA